MKSYLHATDLSRAVLDIVAKAPMGEIYNVAPAGPISIHALVTMIAECCGISFEELVDVVPDRVGQDAKYHLDSTKIARDLGWVQTIGIVKGIESMVEWARKYPEIVEMDTSYRHMP